MKDRRKARRSWSVLLAEDNDDHALLIKMALERATRTPVEVFRARDGDEALALIEGQPLDLMLLDLKMPGRSGHEVLQVVKGDDEFRRIPVAVLTSSDQDDDIARSYGLGGNHFITKPEDPIELETKLRSLFKNVEELAAIRRGGGRLDPTAASAMTPAALDMRRVMAWGGPLMALLFLVILAWALDVF